MTDPAHSLYGRQFEILSLARAADGHVLVRYRDGIVLRLPRAATSLLSLGHDAPQDRLSRSAVEEFLALVKEYELCPQTERSSPVRSGARSRTKTGKKSLKN